MKKRTLLMILILLTIFIYSFYKINETTEFKDAENKEHDILEHALNTNDDQSKDKIDFNYLKNINKNIIAWIDIPGTNINYPLVQGENNEYYLNHSSFGRSNLIGSIFIDFRNTADFSDTVTMIYGHNVSNEFMFGSISKYKDSNYLENHPLIEVYSLGKKSSYLINDFFQVEVDDVYSLINKSIVKNENKIMLITCSYENGKGLDADLRYVLLATKYIPG